MYARRTTILAEAEERNPLAVFFHFIYFFSFLFISLLSFLFNYNRRADRNKCDIHTCLLYVHVHGGLLMYCGYTLNMECLCNKNILCLMLSLYLTIYLFLSSFLSLVYSLFACIFFIKRITIQISSSAQQTVCTLKIGIFQDSLSKMLVNAIQHMNNVLTRTHNRTTAIVTRAHTSTYTHARFESSRVEKNDNYENHCKIKMYFDHVSEFHHCFALLNDELTLGIGLS